MKSGFWKTDWFFGLVVALVMLLLSNSDLLQSLERKAYDMGVMSSSRAPLDPCPLRPNLSRRVVASNRTQSSTSPE